MHTSKTIAFTVLTAALALPLVAFAAKGDRKNNKGQSSSQTFETFDNDKDGVVTQAEYLRVMKGVLGEEGAKSRFATLDKNNDGKLTKDEFASDESSGKKKGKKKKSAN